MLFELMSVSRVRCALAVYWLTLALATHWPRLDFPNPPMGWMNADKLVHAAVFALLSWLLVYGRLAGRSAGFKKTLIVGVVIGIIYAAIDESTQGWVARTVSWCDLVANLCGVIGIGASNTHYKTFHICRHLDSCTLRKIFTNF